MQGMVMPPRVSPTQLIVVPIPSANLSPETRAALNDKARNLAAELAAAGVRTDSDLRDNYRPGWKYNYWELKACHPDLRTSHAREDTYTHVATFLSRCVNLHVAGQCQSHTSSLTVSLTQPRRRP
jgi:hypothetical protein